MKEELNKIKVLSRLAQNNLDETLMESSIVINLEEIAQKLINNEYDDISQQERKEYITDLISVLQYVFNETSLQELVSNDTYDSLYESYRDLTADEFVGSKIIKSGKLMTNHTYPELRGSLDKVHYFTEVERNGDNKKSLENWIRKLFKNYMNIDSITMKKHIKFDGLSAVFEIDDVGNFIKVITRGYIDDNIGLDITRFFQHTNYDNLFKPYLGIPARKMGIKTELIMTLCNFMEFNDRFDECKNCRIAVSSIVNSDNPSQDAINLITPIPLQISVYDKLDRCEERNELQYEQQGFLNKFYCGIQNGRYQYLVGSSDDHYIKIHRTDEFESVVDQLRMSCNDMQDYCIENGIPFDGMVLSIIEPEKCQLIGRRDDKINLYEIAYKIPAGRSKTKLINVVYQVGLLQSITPVAKVEPIKIMGNTIESVGLSNNAKLTKLDLNIGDEVIITYDIVPKISKDSTCIKGTGRKVVAIHECPVCHQPLNEEGEIVRCVNIDCDSRIIGKVLNYIRKLKIENIGISTVTQLCQARFIESLGDLYRLSNHREDILKLERMGETKFNHIVSGIYSRNYLYPHEFLGSIGIPDIGRRLMEKVCSSIPMDDLISCQDPNMLNRLMSIKGIGEKFAIKIIKGIDNNKSTIDDLLNYVIIRPYDENVQYSHRVLFTKCRDAAFSKFLEDNNVFISDNYNKDVDIVIIPDKEPGKPDVTSTKITKALTDNKLILHISEAKERFNYIQ